MTNHAFTEDEMKALLPEATFYEMGVWFLDKGGNPIRGAEMQLLLEARMSLEASELLVADCLALLTIDPECRTPDWESDRLALVAKCYGALFNDESGVDIRLAAVEKMDREEGKA